MNLIEKSSENPIFSGKLFFVYKRKREKKKKIKRKIKFPEKWKSAKKKSQS